MNDTLEMTPIMEAGLEEVTAAARHIEAEGIQHKVAITGDRNSWSCCYVLSVESQDIVRAKVSLTAWRSQALDAERQARVAARTQARKKAKSASKARKKKRK